jgi:hypothetical protein
MMLNNKLNLLNKLKTQWGELKKWLLLKEKSKQEKNMMMINKAQELKIA